MKTILTALFLTLTVFALNAQATEKPLSNAEKAFIDSIQGLDKGKIVEAFGEPSKIEDLKANDEKFFASIWQYHYLNTDENGEYYQTTELDFLDDKVVMVVFMNNDGGEIPADAVSAPIPKK
jgi:hypothetical protein